MGPMEKCLPVDDGRFSGGARRAIRVAKRCMIRQERSLLSAPCRAWCGRSLGPRLGPRPYLWCLDAIAGPNSWVAAGG